MLKVVAGAGIAPVTRLPASEEVGIAPEPEFKDMMGARVAQEADLRR